LAAENLLDRLRQSGALLLDQLTGNASRELDVGNPVQWKMTVRATIQASSNQLAPGDYSRFSELAVFAEDEIIPVTLAAFLWQITGRLDRGTADSLCVRLADLALITVTASGTGGNISVHDVIRDFLREDNHDLGCYAEDAETVTSELVTNAIEHAGAPQFNLEVMHLAGSGAVAVIVTDLSPDPPVKRDPAANAEHGRGLHIVDALSASWGWRTEERGKAMYAILAREA
jgi:anti-sigma regulatory factor (Ser/Thr protein kinase)